MGSTSSEDKDVQPTSICDIKAPLNSTAEWFRWKDKNFYNKVGYFVTLVDSKLVYSTNSFDVLGITVCPRDHDKDDHKRDGLVGLIGTMYVYDDGTCVQGKKCTCVNGIATTGNKWYVIERVSCNIIRVMYR